LVIQSINSFSQQRQYLPQFKEFFISKEFKERKHLFQQLLSKEAMASVCVSCAKVGAVGALCAECASFAAHSAKRASLATSATRGAAGAGSMAQAARQAGFTTSAARGTTGASGARCAMRARGAHRGASCAEAATCAVYNSSSNRAYLGATSADRASQGRSQAEPAAHTGISAEEKALLAAPPHLFQQFVNSIEEFRQAARETHKALFSKGLSAFVFTLDSGSETHLITLKDAVKLFGEKGGLQS